MPSLRPAGMESHHGVMSAWMKANVPGYDSDKAPSILMPKEAHEMTKTGYLIWRSEMRAQTGGTFDWKNVSEGQARDLADRLMSGADVPNAISGQYWDAFNGYLAGLRAAAA